MELLLTALAIIFFFLVGYFVGRAAMEDEVNDYFEEQDEDWAVIERQLKEELQKREQAEKTSKRGRKHLCHCGRKFNTFKGKRIHQGRSH